MYKVNQEIIPLEVCVDQYQPYYYAGASGDYNSIHIDNEYAKKAGLPGIILQGLCTMAYVYLAVMRDEDPAKLKNFKVRFRSVVRPLDKITVKGTVSKIENSNVTFDLYAENQNGEQVITNTTAILDMR